MKRFEIEYVNGLGDYLDENNISFSFLEANRIAIYCEDLSELFRIAIDFGKLIK